MSLLARVSAAHQTQIFCSCALPVLQSPYLLQLRLSCNACLSLLARASSAQQTPCNRAAALYFLLWSAAGCCCQHSCFFANNPQAVATLEGIALLGDPQYQMVAQAYPFVARRVLRNDSSGAGALLRDMLYDSTGQLRPARLSALLQVCARIAVSC